MRQKFSTPRRFIAICAALLVLGAGLVHADDLALAPGVPERYVVQKGDTLWSIAGRYLKDPWRWPEIWRLNRQEVKNPHWIYPGDVVVFQRGTPGGPGTPAQAPRLVLERENVRISPMARATPLDSDAIPSIPPGDIEPYLSRPLVTGPEGLVNAASIIAGRDARVIRGDGDVVFASGIDRKSGDIWNLYRPGRKLTAWNQPDVVLGWEQRYLGTARVERFGDVSTVRILSAREEIVVGDLLVPAPREQILAYVPHAPEKPVSGRIIQLNQDAIEAGRGWLVTIDLGKNDGLDVGAVLAVSRVLPPVPDPRPSTQPHQILRFLEQTTVYRPESYLELPPERSGLLFVYRVFDTVSFAVLLNTTEPVNLGDVVHQP
jgi:hypothetical protein